MAETGHQVKGHSPHQNLQIFRSQCIGEGSFGAVYKAQLDLLPCAAKTLRHDLFTTNSAKSPAIVEGATVEKVESGFECLYQLRHPNVVQCLGVCRDDETGLPVLLMEMAQENLSSFLQRNPLISNRLHVQVNVSYDVTLALHFLHSNGIVHGNLSGNNILMFPSHRAKLSDLHVIDLPIIQSADGSPRHSDPSSAYMSPEVFSDETRVWCEEMDVFSVGVVMLQLVTGHAPQPHPPGRDT